MYMFLDFSTQIVARRGSLVPQTKGLIHQFGVFGCGFKIELLLLLIQNLSIPILSWEKKYFVAICLVCWFCSTINDGSEIFFINIQTKVD